MVKAIKILGLLLVCLSVYGTTVNSIRIRMSYDGTNAYDTPITVVGINTNNTFRVDFTTTNVTLLQSSDGTNWLTLLTTGYDSSSVVAPVAVVNYPVYYGPYFSTVIVQLPIPDAPVLTAK